MRCLCSTEAPSAPSGVEVVEVGSRWLSLVWAVDGSGATHHVIQFRREPSSAVDADSGAAAALPPQIAQHSAWHNVTVQGGGQRAARVTALEPATTYAVRVLAANEVGVGPPSSPVTAQTLQEGQRLGLPKSLLHRIVVAGCLPGGFLACSANAAPRRSDRRRFGPGVAYSPVEGTSGAPPYLEFRAVLALTALTRLPVLCCRPRR